MKRKVSNRLMSGEIAAALRVADQLQLLDGEESAAAQMEMNPDWFTPYERLTIRMFRMAKINDPELIDSIRNQVAISFALSVIEDRYDPDQGTVGAYLWGMVYYTCRSEIRRYKRFPKLRDFHEFDVTADARTDPIAEAGRHEMQQVIRNALVKLPPRYRIALSVEYGICDEGGMIPTPGEPRNDLVLFRARRRLRDILDKRCPDIAGLF